jgi:hypothetical protein
VKDRKPIDEDDIYLTEMLIARSYGKLKRSVVDVSSKTLNSVGGTLGGTIKEHPYASAGAAVGAGIILFGLMKLMNRNSSSKGRGTGGRESSSGTGLNIVSLLMPIVSPYFAAFLEKLLGDMFSKDKNRNA